MRSGWPHTQEDPGSLASQRQAQYGPADSWPNGYPALEYPEGDYRYPQHGTDPYAVGTPAPAGPPGEHPYGAFGGGQAADGYNSPNIEAFGYGDPGYSDLGYDGPASEDAGIASTQTVRGFVESSAPHDGGYARGSGYGSGYVERAYPAPGEPVPGPPMPGGPVYDGQAGIYQQPWDYDQPLRYDDEESAYPLQDSYGQTAHTPPAYDPENYNGSEFSVPGITGTGYDLSGIIGTSEFPGIGYDQPGYDRLSYDDPRYDSPFETRDSTRFDMPAVEDGPRGTDTRFDMPALDSPPARQHGSTRFDMPAVDDFDSSRLDHVWPAREDLPGNSGFFGDSLSQTSLDLGVAAMSQTRFDMPAVEDYRYGDRFEETSVDGMRALAPETEFRAAGAGLVAPADEQPMSWADETSFDRFGDVAELDAQDMPVAFTPAPQAAPLRTGEDTGSRRAVGGKRRGRSGDKRQWMALGAIAIAATGMIGGVMMKFVFSGPSGPAHTVSTPDKVAGFNREPNLEQQMKVDQLRNGIIAKGGGKISDAVSAVYQQGSSAVGSNPQTYIFVGGKLADSDPQASVTNFEQTQAGAHAVSAGSLGGEAACATASVSGESVSMCVWFDNDTFGEFVSPTMTPTTLASTMDQARPSLEHLAQ
jgi:hypothetical protein